MDSSDRERFTEAFDELQTVLNDDRLIDTCLLILANKQDIPGSISIVELAEKLGLYKLKRRQWYIQGTSAINGKGLEEGFTWLADMVKANARARRASSCYNESKHSGTNS